MSLWLNMSSYDLRKDFKTTLWLLYYTETNMI